MKRRIISAIIMILITLPFIILGGIPFYCFTLVISQGAMYELLKFRKKLPIYIKILAHIMTGLVVMADLLKIQNGILLQIILLILLIIMIFEKDNRYHYKDAFFLYGIICFIGYAFYNIINIRNHGLEIFIYIVLTAVITDTFAFIIGKKFGKHKLAPLISPNKTIEGLIGGVLVSSIISSIYYIFIINNKNIFVIIAITLLLSIIGQIGDLIKSKIKRYEKIKDFSLLIPGHGGIIDRLDSLIFISMIYNIICNLI